MKDKRDVKYSRVGYDGARVCPRRRSVVTRRPRKTVHRSYFGDRSQFLANEQGNPLLPKEGVNMDNNTVFVCLVVKNNGRSAMW